MTRLKRWMIGALSASSLALSFGGALEHPASAATLSGLRGLENTIYRDMNNRETSFTVQIPTSEFADVKRAFNEALAKNDYLREDYHGSQFVESALGATTTVNFSVSYWESRSQYQYVLRRTEAIVKQITSPLMTPLQKEFAIHNYLVLHLAYDLTQQNVSPYDALTKGTVVCQGYAMLTYLMLTEAHIKNYIVDGSAGGQSHAWNLVLISGHWYNLDTTWDDPVPNEPGVVHYDYFNLTDAQLRRTHTWNAKGLPVANTNFVTWLSHQPGVSQQSANAVLPSNKSADSYQSIWKTTGLYLETPAYTYNTPSSLVAALSHRNGTTYRFRYPYALVSKDLSNLNLASGYQLTYEQDGRDPTYAIVTIHLG